MDIEIIDLKTRDYKEVWDIQKDILLKRERKEIGDTLITVEHPHVITIGRHGKKSNVLNNGLPCYEIERGGDVTYHGPGQIVCYPIIKLDEAGLSLREYITKLEDTIIQCIGDFGINGYIKEGQIGVWVKEKKIASIGVAVSRWVTYHGFALNVSTDLSYFNFIRPCGMESNVMTSMEVEAKKRINIVEVKKILIKKFIYEWNNLTKKGDMKL